jgi:precorrin-6B C5,15-methyltransferase / cobalt-precorrin-6B C5,C15-methyltransferase
MSDVAWLTIVGIGEDGPEGLPPASLKALRNAQMIFGAERHLALLSADLAIKGSEWPVPFEDGIAPLLTQKGSPTVMLASGDPFWFGAGSVITRHLDAGEWRTLATPSSFSLAAAHLNWPMEQLICHGLHAAPFERMRRDLQPGQRLLVTLRNGTSASELATYLLSLGLGGSMLHILEALGGPRMRHRSILANDYDLKDVAHPVMMAIHVHGHTAISLASGQDDAIFENDGQITKRPVRALTLSALAPRAGEMLWDIGSGSGSIAIEWLLCHPACNAVSIEQNQTRSQRISGNAKNLGADRLKVVTGAAPGCLEALPMPNAVFIGGGLSQDLLETLDVHLPKGTRLVANAVTLESEALLTSWRERLGGELMRINLSQAETLGSKYCWNASYPIVQWSVIL